MLDKKTKERYERELMDMSTMELDKHTKTFCGCHDCFVCLAHDEEYRRDKIKISTLPNYSDD